MKKQNTATQAQGAQVAKQLKPTNKVETKQGKAKEAKHANEYQANVLQPIKALKQESKKLGHAIGVLLQHSNAINLQPVYVELLKQVQKDSKQYDAMNKQVRKTKSGGTCAFYLLQLLYKLDKATK